jgi:muconolactone delta-isomerase
MLYLIISTPTPAKADDLKDARRRFLAWIEQLKQAEKVKQFYPRVGRGIVVILNVESNEELHLLLSAWSNFVPAQFEIYPLVDPAFHEASLEKQ